MIGDGCQTGNTISLGPGIAIGPRCRIASGVTLAGCTVDANIVIIGRHRHGAPPNTPDSKRLWAILVN
ncbi:hypothetical protein [Streptomyces sp. NPDC017529]|uniref:hypothetical protein n=1 Tax=Streptomyces sp. NPDC017529 TaxID=3365000 RepID=UPI00379A7895